MSYKDNTQDTDNVMNKNLNEEIPEDRNKHHDKHCKEMPYSTYTCPWMYCCPMSCSCPMMYGHKTSDMEYRDIDDDDDLYDDNEYRQRPYYRPRRPYRPYYYHRPYYRPYYYPYPYYPYPYPYYYGEYGED